MEPIHLTDMHAYVVTGCIAVILVLMRSFKLPASLGIGTSMSKRADSLPYPHRDWRIPAYLAGAMSAAAWIHGIGTGTGLSFAWKYSLIELPAAYPFFSVAGFTSLVMLAILAQINAMQASLPNHAKALP